MGNTKSKKYTPTDIEQNFIDNTKSKKYTPTDIEQNFIDKYSIPDTLTVRQVEGGHMNVTQGVQVNREKVVLAALFMRDSFRWYSQLNEDDFYIARITTGTEEQEARDKWAKMVETEVINFIFPIVHAFKNAGETLYAPLPNPILENPRFKKLFGKYIAFIGKDTVQLRL